jgi:hypothetical protein
MPSRNVVSNTSTNSVACFVVVMSLSSRFRGNKKAARLGGFGVRRMTHAYEIMMIAIWGNPAPAVWLTPPV